MAGAIPVLIPMYLRKDLIDNNNIDHHKLNKATDEHLLKVDDILKDCDALIFPGNKRDINPSLYGVDKIHPETKKRLPQNLLNVRQETEIRMIQFALKKRNLPILGICGGMQLINVVLGGSLVQHLPDDPRIPNDKGNPHHDKKLKDLTKTLLHNFEENFEQIIEGKKDNNLYPGTHPMKVIPNSLLAKIYQENDPVTDLSTIKELSIHHQGCFKENLSKQLTATAISPDGVIEAAEHKDYPKMFLVTQFHPECNASGIALNLIKEMINN